MLRTSCPQHDLASYVLGCSGQQFFHLRVQRSQGVTTHFHPTKTGHNKSICKLWLTSIHPYLLKEPFVSKLKTFARRTHVLTQMSHIKHPTSYINAPTYSTHDVSHSSPCHPTTSDHQPFCRLRRRLRPRGPELPRRSTAKPKGHQAIAGDLHVPRGAARTPTSRYVTRGRSVWESPLF